MHVIETFIYVRGKKNGEKEKHPRKINSKLIVMCNHNTYTCEFQFKHSCI
jgi:hypothetical protein